MVSDDSPVNTNNPWFQPWFPSGAKWILSRHSLTFLRGQGSIHPIQADGPWPGLGDHPPGAPALCRGGARKRSTDKAAGLKET